MDAKQIQEDRRKYSAQLSELERQVTALHELLAALDKLEGNSLVQTTLPFNGATKTITVPLKLTGAVMRIIANNEGKGFDKTTMREHLIASGYDVSNERFAKKLTTVLLRQKDRGLLRGEKVNGRWVFYNNRMNP